MSLHFRSPSTTLRKITPPDLARVLVVQNAVPPGDTCTDGAALASHLALEPSASLLALEGDEPLGYLVASPSVAHEPVGPRSLARRVPAGADALHLHDLVIAPVARGRGLAHWLIESAFQHAFEAGLLYAAGVALPRSQKFLLRFGFRSATHVLDGPARHRVARYGLGAQYMLRPFFRGTPLFG